jgi:2-keto-4-pentenoate hydratase/2-oxohepta-3-ene-1,7-dioic acid hydratase in catechol pathway
MKLATYLRGASRAPRLGAASGAGMLDLADALAQQQVSPAPDVASMRRLLAAGEPALAALRDLVRRAGDAPARFASALVPMEEVTFLPPVPDADKFLCVGKNYRAHLEELKRTDLIRELPQEPTAFVKLNSCLTGHDSDVIRPADVTHLDYEPELVFVLGRRADRVARGEALSYVAGITILNDLTCRDTQKREVASGSRFWTSKNAPGFGPLGPWIVTLDEVPDPYDIWVTCRVNGETRMRVNTADQIWKIDDILPHFSRLVPLEPGDMFSTGAPGGVAVGKANAEALFLKPGDVVECAFEAPAMTLRNRIVAPARAA